MMIMWCWGNTRLLFTPVCITADTNVTAWLWVTQESWSSLRGVWGLWAFPNVKTNRETRAMWKGREKAAAAVCFHCDCGAARTQTRRIINMPRFCMWEINPPSTEVTRQDSRKQDVGLVFLLFHQCPLTTADDNSSNETKRWRIDMMKCACLYEPERRGHAKEIEEEENYSAASAL